MNKSVTHKFETTAEAIQFLNKIFDHEFNHERLHGMAERGFQTHSKCKGWKKRKVKKEKN